ncbi:L-seryl-tRNA(Sec) selenium transferase [Arsenicicoccus sp. oral taxon 190]|uniref:L-seryl-tRNA(Sec) selenium transferase n=1 Tax=Arsenicicoccus sp. oral taxon 190 TaxID=1658671 RepID=UPI000679F245|nr:L-seryl-tRNA(Sec) selenium transferase [Arsenicicoccus sp. oral taxon 190]AKT52301.1 selenocysteine synthase [Arsenicicoccus sp. oral taxon 190]
MSPQHLARAVPPASGDPRRGIVRTDAALAAPELAEVVARRGRAAVRTAVRAAQDRARQGEIAPDEVVAAARQALEDQRAATEVFNATGVVLHTNLGRAQLGPDAVDALVAASGCTDVELDLASGVRARRGRQTLDALSRRVPDAAGVLVVNNGAAALVLALTALAQGREVLVSRGEMVEIGDGFRIPDLLESTGVRLREVGTTNRTRLADYADAVTERTAAILKVHPSNFRVEGFTSEATITELATLGLPVVADTGSGLLAPDPALPDEPDAATALRAGATVVTCSGDKLLGGPQAGLVFGDADTVERLRRHPLQRALRADKLALAALAATLDAATTPTSVAIHADEAELRARAEQLASLVEGQLPVEVVPSAGRVGGGAAPGLPLPGWALALPESYADRLRLASPPVVARVEAGRTLVDVRCLPPDRLGEVAGAIREVASRA